MKISERTIKRLGQIITGDSKNSPYRSGPKLVSFFNEFGRNDVYKTGFPPRWTYAEDCIREFNGTSTLRKIIISAFDPRDYIDVKIPDPETQTEKAPDIKVAVQALNQFLSFDGYEVVSHGKGYDVVDKTRGEILCDIKLETNNLSYIFIAEQIEKCHTKVSQGDYDGAITNARSLVEAVLAAIEKEFDKSLPDYDGNLPKLYKRVHGHLNLSADNPKISDMLKQILSGLSSIVQGLSGISNKMSDRHVREYKPSHHHAVLAVNSAMTFSNFIFDTYVYQKELREKVA